MSPDILQRLDKAANASTAFAQTLNADLTFLCSQIEARDTAIEELGLKIRAKDSRIAAFEKENLRLHDEIVARDLKIHGLEKDYTHSRDLIGMQEIKIRELESALSSEREYAASKGDHNG